MVKTRSVHFTLTPTAKKQLLPGVDYSAMFGLWLAIMVLYVGCLSSTVASGDTENIFVTFQPDLQPFQNTVKAALKSSGSLNTSMCDIPDGAIMYTLSNQHLFPLLAIRQEAMAKKGVLDCLQQRFITACLDAKCFALCQTHKFSNCAFIDIPETPYTAFGAHATEYQKNSYSYIVWLKWETMFSALQLANEVFYMDADVVLLGNPFPDTRFGRDNTTGRSFPSEYDIMYQRERGMKEIGCGGSVNGGLIYMRNTTATQERLIPAITKHKLDMIQLKKGALSDQDLVGKYVKLVRRCTLPVARFMGHCKTSQAKVYDPTKVITFHTNCVAGLDTKIRIIRAFIDKAVPSTATERLNVPRLADMIGGSSVNKNVGSPAKVSKQSRRTPSTVFG